MMKFFGQMFNLFRKIQARWNYDSIRHHLLALKLKLLYQKRISKPDNKISLEPVDPTIIRLGTTLRDQILNQYHQKYKYKTYRLLFHIPPNGLGIIWFNDLIQTLDYVGIPCASVKWEDPNFRETWDAFQPNIFISMEIPRVLRSIDLDYILAYKQSHRCLRLFTPSDTYRFPEPGLSKEDQWRLDLARSGRSVDAYFCMFVDEFFKNFFSEWQNSGFKFLSLPHGCNPLYHYPREGNREFDFFMATSYGPERVEITWKYLKPIFKKYRGLWAGPGWGFGMGGMRSDELPSLYARSKIVPNPLARFLIQFPSEITERAFSATACGAFQISDWTPVTDRFFAPDEFLCVRGEKDFLEKFNYYVANPHERDAIVIKGLRRVFAEHTYFHRIDTLIAFLDNNQELF
jgi:hypothetical protein